MGIILVPFISDPCHPLVKKHWDPGEQVAELLLGSRVTLFCERVTGLQRQRRGEGNFQEGSIP